MPDPYPIENFGLFNTLFRISQRNLGNIVKLYSNLFITLGDQRSIRSPKLLKFTKIFRKQ